jgi:hypothetical protein
MASAVAHAETLANQVCQPLRSAHIGRVVPYEVAKLIGGTAGTIEKRYAPLVGELRERARRIMETGEGLEQITDTQRPRQNDAGVKPD